MGLWMDEAGVDTSGRLHVHSGLSHTYRFLYVKLPKNFSASLEVCVSSGASHQISDYYSVIPRSSKSKTMVCTIRPIGYPG